MRKNYGFERPSQCPELVRAFIAANDIGSESLRQELGREEEKTKEE
jgi:hypothetical protein